jgi:hypothetical protein
MLDELPRYPFTLAAVTHAPEDAGVFLLWEGAELTRIGLAPSPQGGIRLELMAILEKRAYCPCSPTHYSWLLARDPITAASELLREHGQSSVELPRCNRATPSPAGGSAPR